MPGKKRQRPTDAADEKSEGFHSMGETWSKSKKKRMRKKRSREQQLSEKLSNTKKKSRAATDPEKLHQAKHQAKQHDKSTQVTEAEASASMTKFGRSSSLLQSFRERLSGSRFRELNEALYTSTSSSAFSKFSKSPELYDQYHQGFRHQVKDWPVNPVDVIVQSLVTKYQHSQSESGQTIRVADFGCGDAALAKKLLEVNNTSGNSSSKKKKKKTKTQPIFTIHSFDLVAVSDLVTACDMAHVPLEDRSVDVAVFCLSLMGTNLADFIREAHRVLTDKGILKIAEVRSRFESSSSSKDKGAAAGEELEGFVDVLDKLGFECYKKDRRNKMFITLECRKNAKQPHKKLEYSAKPCIYKRR